MVVTEAFEPIARATFTSRGRIDHPLVILPSSVALAHGQVLTTAASTVLEEAFPAAAAQEPPVLVEGRR